MFGILSLAGVHHLSQYEEHREQSEGFPEAFFVGLSLRERKWCGSVEWRGCDDVVHDGEQFVH